MGVRVRSYLWSPVLVIKLGPVRSFVHVFAPHTLLLVQHEC